jgi:glycosyltransferase involved in cell wall biosynthesis
MGHGKGVKPRVTIAIPCYQQGVFLFECLNSLIAQTLVEWEAFVVDDCSSESTIEGIVASYDDFRIRCLRHQENRGLAASRNTAIRAGNGPAVLCLDADDFLHPEFLCATLNALERGSADCAFADFQCVGVESPVWSFDVKPLDELARSQWIPGAGAIMRRSLWERVGGYCDALELRAGNEDWDFWIGAASLGISAVHVPRPLYFYRRHATSMSKSVLAPNEWKTREFMLKRHAAFFATGDRARVFRTDGLLRSAQANRRAGHRSRALLLTARAVASNPKILFGEMKFGLRRRLSPVVSLIRRGFRKIRYFTTKTAANGNGEVVPDPPRDWDDAAPFIHSRDGHLSHDYAVLGTIIRRTGARSVLEIGCGSGRLVPVYLLHAMSPIWVEDTSPSALEICHQRFFHQEQIRYFAGRVEEMGMNESVDLVVSTKVLQHVLDEDELRRMISYLAKKTRSFFINEATVKDTLLLGSRGKGRDYTEIFQSVGFQLRDQGELEADGGARQSWKLFEKNLENLSKATH